MIAADRKGWRRPAFLSSCAAFPPARTLPMRSLWPSGDGQPPQHFPGAALHCRPEEAQGRARERTVLCGSLSVALSLLLPDDGDIL